MPVPRLQKKEESPRYVVVERSGNSQAQEMEESRATSAPTPTTFSTRPSGFQPEPTALRIRDDDDGGNDDDDRGPPPVVRGESRRNHKCILTDSISGHLL